MNSDTDEEDETDGVEQEEAQSHRQQRQQDVIFDTCSDGSVYNFTNGNTAAGYSAVTECNGVRSVKRYNSAPHPTWTSSTAVLNYNPETTHSTSVEAKG